MGFSDLASVMLPVKEKPNVVTNYSGPGEAESAHIGGSGCTFKATGKDTRGQAGVAGALIPALYEW